MTRYRISPSAYADLAEIHDYSESRWGQVRADAYSRGLFELFRRIGEGAITARPARAEYEVDLRYCNYERHHVYWRKGDDRSLIVAVLHQNMDAPDRLREALAELD